MKNEEKRKITIPCEICQINPASNIKGGIYNDKRELWFVCNSCLLKISNSRKRRE